MTGEELRAMVERAKAAKAAGKLTPDMEATIMKSINDGVKSLKDEQDKDPVQFQEKLNEARSMIPSGMGPGIQEAVDEYATDVALGKDPKQIAQENLTYGARALDLATGAAPARLAIAKATGVGQPGEFEALLKGQGAPTGADIAERYKGLEGSPVLQTAVATGLDVVDPGLLIGGGEALLKTAVRPAGKKLFAAGFRDIEKVAVRQGKAPGQATEVMMKYGITGSAEQRLAKREAAKQSLGDELGQIGQQAAAAGAVVPEFSTELAKLSADLDKVMKTSKSGPQAAVAADLKPLVDDQLTRVSGEGKTPTLDEVLQIKRDWRNNLPANAYDMLAKTDEGKKITKRISNIAQTESEKAVERTLGKDAADRFKQVNADLGVFYTTDKPAFQQYSKEMTKNPDWLPTSVEGMLAPVSPQSYGAKKLADMLKANATGIGANLATGNVGPRTLAYPAAAALVGGAKAGTRNIYEDIKNGNRR